MNALSVREERAFKSYIIDDHFPSLKIEIYRGKQEIGAVCVSFSKSFYFLHIFAALELFSNSVSAQAGRGGLL